jgi:hypothetical protein
MDKDNNLSVEIGYLGIGREESTTLCQGSVKAPQCGYLFKKINDNIGLQGARIRTDSTLNWVHFFVPVASPM